MGTVPLEQGWRHFKHRGFEDVRRAAKAEGARRDEFRRSAAENFRKAAEKVPEKSPNEGKDKLENLLNAVKCAPHESERQGLLKITDLLVKQIELGNVPFSKDDTEAQKAKKRLIPEAKKLIAGAPPRFEEVIGLKIRSPVRDAVQVDEMRGDRTALIRRELEELDMPDPLETELPAYLRS